MDATLLNIMLTTENPFKGENPVNNMQTEIISKDSISENSFEDMVKSYQPQPNLLPEAVNQLTSQYSSGNNITNIFSENILPSNENNIIQQIMLSAKEEHIVPKIDDNIDLSSRVSNDPMLISGLASSHLNNVVPLNNVVINDAGTNTLENITQKQSFINNITNELVSSPKLQEIIPIEKDGTSFKEHINNDIPLGININNLAKPMIDAKKSTEIVTDDGIILPNLEVTLPEEISSMPKYYSKSQESDDQHETTQIEKPSLTENDVRPESKDYDSDRDDHSSNNNEVDNSSRASSNQASNEKPANEKIANFDAEIKAYDLHNNVSSNDYDEVQIRILRATNEGNNKINIQLHPAELGKIEVHFDISDKASHISIVADKAQTLEMLQKDARNLEKVLNDVGLKSDSSSLSFSLSHGGDRQSQDNRNPNYTDFSESEEEVVKETTLLISNNYISNNKLDLKA